MAKRTVVSPKIQAQIQFDADRTCCVYRTPGKPIQIHHIDEDPTNHSPNNLVVLCRDCHDLTMIRGTFNRRLDADVVTLYRDDWIAVVAERRASNHKMNEPYSAEDSHEFANVVEKLEILKGRKQYSFLAIEYDRLGNYTLRDKYIEKSLKSDPSDLNVLFLRALQNRPEKIPAATVARIVDRQTRNNDWSQLARTYADIGDAKNSIVSYCKSIMKSIEENNIFSAGYYLKELTQKQLHVPIFQETYAKYEAERNLWWALRTLRELEWWSETHEFLLRNEKLIEREGDPLLLKQLYSTKGDFEKYRQLELDEAETIFSDTKFGFVGFKRKKRKTDSP
jgi:tetratricopeptide (TPR) repeat protein